VLLLLTVAATAGAGDTRAVCDIADCVNRIRRLAPAQPVELSPSELAGTWRSGTGLGGSILYLFEDGTYLSTQWADVMYETVADKGTWRVASTVVVLTPDGDVTWSSPNIDRRYLVYRASVSSPVRLLGLDSRLGILERVVQEVRGRNELALKAASMSRSRRWRMGESARRKAAVMEECWNPGYWSGAK
jgi:hypothetical protein